MLHERVALCEILRAVNSSRGLDCSTITPPGGSCDKWQGCPSVQQPVFGTDVIGRSGREKVPRVQQESLRRKTLFALFSQTKTVSLTESLQHQTAHDTKLFCFVFLKSCENHKNNEIEIYYLWFCAGPGCVFTGWSPSVVFGQIVSQSGQHGQTWQ